MDLALNNLDGNMPLNTETKPNQTKQIMLDKNDKQRTVGEQTISS